MAKTEEYKIDPSHSFVQFKANHMNFSWLMGRFNHIEGALQFDEQNIENSSVKVTINTASLDSNHAKRDKHLKSDDYIDASKFPKAEFASKSVSQQGENILIKGDLKFRGITKPMTITAKLVGAGKSPWGDTRRGYEGTATIDWTDFGMKGKPGNKRSQVELRLFIEAIK
jgi:polyisoprenoid-binding protein YceI